MIQQLNVRFRWIFSHFLKTKIMGCKEAENCDLSVLHLSENFVIVNKQFDIPINTDTPDVYPVTVATQLDFKFPHLSDTSVRHGFRFVHRLDYSTSGVLCIALNKLAAKAGGKAFDSKLVSKYYLALLHGHVNENSLLLDKAIGVDSRPEYSHCMCTSDKDYCVSAKWAATKLLVLQRGLYNGKPATKVLLKLVTGRRHQIRVHCHELGHTIVGDFTYSNRQDVIPYRMFLHAYRLVMPTALEKIDITSEDPFTEKEPRNKWTPCETVNELNSGVFSKV